MAHQGLDTYQKSILFKLTPPRLLVVCEDQEELKCYSAVLRRHGFSVTSMDSYAQAASCVRNTAFDLILVSQGGPTFKGRSVVEHAVGRDRQTPVLVITHFVDFNCYLDAMHVGATDYVEAPMIPEDLTTLVSAHVHRRHMPV